MPFVSKSVGYPHSLVIVLINYLDHCTRKDQGMYLYYYCLLESGTEVLLSFFIKTHGKRNK